MPVSVLLLEGKMLTHQDTETLQGTHENNSPLRGKWWGTQGGAAAVSSMELAVTAAPAVMGVAAAASCCCLQWGGHMVREAEALRCGGGKDKIALERKGENI